MSLDDWYDVALYMKCLNGANDTDSTLHQKSQLHQKVPTQNKSEHLSKINHTNKGNLTYVQGVAESTQITIYNPDQHPNQPLPPA